jgi:RNA polymerase sigma factor (sigma-70 family)
MGVWKSVLVRSRNEDLARLYIDLFPQLVRLAFMLTGSNDVAEDLVQDVFVRVADRLVQIDYPPTYLRAAVVNAARSRHRRNTRPTRLPMRTEAQPPSELVELHDVLLALPVRQRTALVLRYVTGLTDGEIAKILGCTETTVRSLVHRGLASLRRVVP